MGYTKCAVRGCKSRPGQTDPEKKKIFKGFPSKVELQDLWLRHLPKGFTVTKRSTAVCEDHFHSSQFERVRWDNKKKLMENAVPFYTPPVLPVASVVRKPFGDLTNTSIKPVSVMTPTVLDHDYLPVRHFVNVAPAQTIVMDSSEADVAQIFNPGLNSTVVCENSLSESEEIECSNVVNSVLPGSFSGDIPVVAEWSNGTFILDDVTGDFKLSESQESVEFEQTYATLKTNALECLSQLCEKQSCKIEELNAEIAEINDYVEKLKCDIEFHGYFNLDFKKKYDALRKKQERMQKSYERDNFSPWLSQKQLSRLFRKSNRGIKWDIEDIRSGLVLKMKCGTSGYSAFVTLFPILPSVSVLQKSVQFVRFDSGLLMEIFDLLKGLLKNASESWKDCQLVLDEMAIQQGEKYCNSLKKWVGQSTLPTHSGVATKALVFLLAGITKRWKLAVAVYFTNKKSEESMAQKERYLTGHTYSKIVDSIIVNADSVGANVVNVTSDMGSDNLAFWGSKGVTGGRGKNVTSSFPHPVYPEKKVYALPDSVHLMKSIKTMMENNNVITLPNTIVEEEKLPTNIVDYRHVEDLYEFESEGELKVAFRLRPDNIRVKQQFVRMSAGSTKAVMCHNTGAALNGMAQVCGKNAYKTTAWFFIFINLFFDLVTARHRTMAVSRSDEKVFQKTLSLIRKMEFLFHNMRVGESGVYKPCQRGVRVLCHSLLGLIDYLVVERGYQFLMLGRFTSDCLENLFSCIRLAQAIPHAAAFLQNLKVITLAQFSEAVKGSSYAYEEGCALPGDFLEEARKKANERAHKRFEQSFEELCQHSIRKLEQRDYRILNWWQKVIVYDMAGSVIAAIERGNLTRCEQCLEATKWKGQIPHEMSLITDLKEFTSLRADDEEEGELKEALLHYVSDAVYRAILTAEISFRLYREKTVNFVYTDVLQYFVENLMYVWEGSNVPNCHNLGRKILTIFFDARLKEFGKRRTELIKTDLASKRSSKSATMHVMADGVLLNK